MSTPAPHPKAIYPKAISPRHPMAICLVTHPHTSRRPLPDPKTRLARARRRPAAGSLSFAFTAAPSLGRDAPLVRFDGVDVERPGCGAVLRGVTLSVGARARIAVLGPNGVGKSTLVEALVGGETAVALAGTIGRHAHLRVAYVRQHHLGQLEPYLDQSSTRYVMAKVAGASELDARRLLGSVSLGRHAAQPVGVLSGGERLRLIMAAEVLPCHPHLIVMDEPTNHFDLESLDALTAGLATFQGALVCISHHREFVATFATELWLLERGEVDAAARVRVEHAEDRVDVEALIECR